MLPQRVLLFSALLLSLLVSAHIAGVSCQSSTGVVNVRSRNFNVQGAVYNINASCQAAVLCQLQGDCPTMGNNTNAEIFWGIPFAQPPTGPLRLEKPLPVLPYSARLDCTNSSSMPPCYAAEDCLKLVIARPAGTTKTSRLPVLVWIHGGGFTGGSAGSDGPPGQWGLVDFYVAQGIVVVELQYRLALLGFGSDGSSQLPGNLGLFDQQMALRWVHENIAAFGGDHSRVTIYGVSAGSGSVSMHTINPQSSRYFAQAIQMSGSFAGPWAIQPTATLANHTLQMADIVGCANRSGSSLKLCLKGVSFGAISAALATLPAVRTDFAITHFSPRFDDDFFASQDLSAMVAAVGAKPTMVGFNSDESLIWTMASPYYTRHNIPDSIVTSWTVGSVDDMSAFYNYSSADLADFVRQYIVPASGSPSAAAQSITALRNQLIEFYTESDNRANAGTNPAFYFQQYTRLITDVEFIVPAMWESRLKAQKGWPVHVFQFDHVSASVLADLPYPGAWHAGDGPYDTGSPSWDLVSFDEDDLAVQRAIVSAMTNFIKTGHPGAAGGASWPALNFTGSACNQANVSYTAENVNPHPFVESGPSGWDVAERLAFWDGLAASFDLGRVHSFPNTMGQCVPNRRTH